MSTHAASVRTQHTDSHAAALALWADATRVLGGTTPTFALVFASPDHDLGAVLAGLRTASPRTALIGCTTAGEITQDGLTHGSVSALFVASDSMNVATDVMTGLRTAPDAAAKLATTFAAMKPQAHDRGFVHAATLVLVDGLTGAGERLVAELRGYLGGLHDIVGGAAGDEGRFQATYVGTDRDVGLDAAAILHVASAKRFGVGVDHGLTAAGPLMRVTRAQGNTVFELDGEPAFAAYRDFAAKRGVELTPDNTSRFMIQHELGINVLGNFREARAPLACNPDGSLTCAASIPQGASVAILDGNKVRLTTAARNAALEARERAGTDEIAAVVLFDCVCRGMLLDRDFPDEIAAVRAVFPDSPLGGFLTYGEIARYSGRLDGWHNTTAVVVAIPK